MNFNSANPRPPSKLGAKRLPQEIDISPSGQNFPPPYNYYDSPVPPQPQTFPPYQPSAPAASFGQPMGGNYNAPPGFAPASGDSGFSLPGQYLNPLVASTAMNYGQHLMGTGKEYMDKEIEKYVPVTRLKYYFAVDTAYVVKKLRLLLFPFTNQDWSIKYASSEPIQPRFEVNAPDLYIPTMAYLTYVLVAGLALGTQDRFTPEMLGIQASSALAWTILEILLCLLSLYITNISTSLTTFDILAFSGYKFVGIIIAVLSSLLFHRTGYYTGLIYCSFAVSFFLHLGQTGNKRRYYLLLSMAAMQPFLMWWLSYHLIASAPLEAPI